MADVFCATGPGQRIHRAVSGSLLAGGEYRQLQEIAVPFPYRGQPAAWGRSRAGSLPLALALLADCLGEDATADDSWEDTASWRLHEQFAGDIIWPLDAAAPLALEWYAVQSWIDQHTLGEPGPLTGCITRIRDFEALLRAALAEDDLSRPRHVDPGLWGQWDIEMLVSLCAARRDPPSGTLRPFADHLLDLKFKLYCLLEVDLPAYAAAIRRWGLEPGDVTATPQGFAARLSEEVTLIIKSRAVWESVMNAVCWYATGRQARTVKAVAASGASFASKTGKFFPWVAAQPQWASLATFEPLVTALDQLRTPEVHNLSRVRADFTRLVLRPVGQCVELLQRVLRYVFDHLTTVIALGRAPCYDASAGNSVTMELLSPAPAGAVRGDARGPGS
jgi:hypothetical protein